MSNDTKHGGPVDVREILDRRAAEAAFLGRDIAALELRDVMAAMAELIEAAHHARCILALHDDRCPQLEAALANVGSAS